MVLKRVKVRGKREMKEEGRDVSNRMAAEGLKPKLLRQHTSYKSLAIVFRSQTFS